jgi:hypothetical protein
VKAPRKLIYNPRTGKYYAQRLQSSTEGRKGTIQGLWKHPKQPFSFNKAHDEPLGVSAENPRDWGEKIQSLDSASIEFHLERGDFELACYLAGMHDIHDVRDVRELAT